jgi:hypothetical protein
MIRMHLARARTPLACLLVTLAAAVPVALAQAPAAAAATEAWCKSCSIGAYGGETNPGVRHPLATVYGHALSPSNGWLCAGSIEGGEYVCNFGETSKGFGGQNWIASVISHYHGVLTLNAHVDF